MDCNVRGAMFKKGNMRALKLRLLDLPVSRELNVYGYHWNAVYVKAELLEKNTREGSPTVSLSLPLSAEVRARKRK